MQKKTETMFFLRINEVKAFHEDEPELGEEEIIDELLCSKCFVDLEKFLTPNIELLWFVWSSYEIFWISNYIIQDRQTSSTLK